MTTQERAFKPSRRALAHHEAGHAVVALLLGRGVKSVALTPGSQAQLGLCEHYTRRWKPGALTEAQFRQVTETDVCISPERVELVPTDQPAGMFSVPPVCPAVPRQNAFLRRGLCAPF